MRNEKRNVSDPFGGFAGSSLPRPCHGIGGVLFLQVELGQFGAHRIAALDAYRRQHDGAVAGFDVEVFRGSDGGGDALGQGQLVLRGKFGKHDSGAAK